MLHEVKAEVKELISNPSFARNLFVSVVAITFSLSGLIKLHGQNTVLTQRSSITNVSNSSSTKIIVDRK